jgi:cytochrome c553
MGSLIMKKITMVSTLLMLAVLPTSLMARPSSQTAWTPEQLNFVKAGNPAKGKELVATCSACHGENGIGTAANFPSLAGQLQTYLYKQIEDYSNGDRQDPMMEGFAKMLSKQDAADLTAWYTSQPVAEKPASPVVYEQAERLAKQGDSERQLPPCAVCHGRNGQGDKMDIPALAGQSAQYTSATLNAFKTGNRHNDIYSRMRLIAKSLTDHEIEELGSYYQNLKQ